MTSPDIIRYCCPRNFLIQEERIGNVVSISHWIRPVPGVQILSFSCSFRQKKVSTPTLGVGTPGKSGICHCNVMSYDAIFMMSCDIITYDVKCNYEIVKSVVKLWKLTFHNVILDDTFKMSFQMSQVSFPYFDMLDKFTPIYKLPKRRWVQLKCWAHSYSIEKW